MFSPSGFTAHEIEKLERAARRDRRATLYFAPGRERANDELFAATVEREQRPSEIEPMTDDRPYLAGLSLDEYTFLPTAEIQSSNFRHQAWIKVTTLFVVAGLAFVVMMGVTLGSGRRVPASVLLYLLATGFAFMLCEVGLMAKLELFLQDPLVAMATVLSIFLLTSGVGSALAGRIVHRIRMEFFLPVVALLVFASIEACDWANTELLTLTLKERVLTAAAIVAPIGMALGVFYPYLVHCLVARERGDVVAISYGLSTLASVIGATYAMTFMVEFGFSELLWQATYAYLALFAFVVVYQGLGGRMLRPTT